MKENKKRRKEGIRTRRKENKRFGKDRINKGGRKIREGKRE